MPERHRQDEVDGIEYSIYSSNQKIIYLRFFNVATLCLNDSFAHSCHSLNQLPLELI